MNFKQSDLRTPLRGAGGPRIQSFDIARGFTVLIMPSIHVVMLYSNPEVQQSWLGNILAFIAEGPGAQLFMLLMGVGFTMSKRINKEYVLKRTLQLITAAYLLNLFKFIIPMLFGWMPQNLLAELNLQNDYTSFPFFLLLGDILHFAAIAYPIIFIIYKLKHWHYWSVTIAIIIIVGSPFIWDLKTNIPFIDYPLQLLGGHPPQCFFPVFPWLVYPLAGLTLGYYIKKNETTITLNKAGLIGLVIIIITTLLPATKQQTEWLPFYRTEPTDTFFHIGIVLLWLCIMQWLTKIIPANPVTMLLAFCSKNITAMYIIQWILICWGMGIAGYMQYGFKATAIAMTTITFLTLILTKLYADRRNHL